MAAACASVPAPAPLFHARHTLFRSAMGTLNQCPLHISIVSGTSTGHCGAGQACDIALPLERVRVQEVLHHQVDAVVVVNAEKQEMNEHDHFFPLPPQAGQS
jgi:hypothetical protein